jgi:hypothetical protein
MSRCSRSGALLFEAMVALAILVMASLSLGSIVLSSVGAMERTRDQMQACDLARSTMAMIEAGLGDPVALNGPVVRWDESRLLEPAMNGSNVAFESADVESEGEPAPLDVRAPGMSAAAIDPDAPAWFLEIETEAHEGTGLWLVTVTARLASPMDESITLASYTLRQLVRLGSGPEDTAGEEDELMDAARRGLNAPGGSR